MKVLHVVPTYWPAVRYGGPIYSVHGLCAALVANGVNVSVFTTSVDGKTNSDVDHGKVYLKDGVKIFYFESKFLRRIYFSTALKQALNEQINQFDIVHLHSIFLYPTNIAARIAAKNKVPYVVSPRGMLEKSLIRNKSKFVKMAWLKMIERKTLEQADLIHLTSARELKELAKFNYGFPKTVLIPNGIDSDLICDNTDSVHFPIFQILFIGRINWKKQINKLIESLLYLDFPVRLIIAGNDEEQYQVYLEEQIDKLKIRESDYIKIDFVGAKHGDQKKELFERSDVMVLPSLSENFGNTVIESMAAGCPVIVTPEVGASEVVEQSQAGLITNGTPQDIAEKLSYLKKNPEQANRMAINGIAEVKQNYLWSNIADTMNTAYRGLLA